MPDAIGKPVNFSERGSAATAGPGRKRRWWMVAIAIVVVGALAVGAIAAYRYLHLCRNCSPILCDDPCTLPTFSQVWELPVTDA
jgi:hypothetical protein